MAMINDTFNERVTDNVIEYVTVVIGEQLFGLPISRVQDVFMPDRLTRVPLSAPEIAGVLNLRAASSRRSICGADWDCRRGRTPARPWRSASSSRANPMGF